MVRTHWLRQDRTGPIGGDRGAARARASAKRLILALLVSIACIALVPAVAGAAAGWEEFGPGEWPGALWRAYDTESPFNTPTTGDPVHPDSAAMVAASLQWGLPANLTDAAGATNDWARPTYWAQPSDPTFTLRATTPGSAQVQGLHIPIPDEAQPAGGSDAQMTVVTPDGWEYDFWHVLSKPAGGGTLTFERGGRTRIDGSGLGSEGTISQFGNLAGAIRAQELASGHIRHALYIVLKCAGTGTGFGHGVQQGPSGTGSFVYPASAGAAECPETDPDLPPLGARFKLAMSPLEITALNVPAWKKTILRALARFGGYVGGTGGPGFGFLLEDSTMYTSLGESDPLAEFASENEVPKWNGQYVFRLAGGVEWRKDLRVLIPPDEPGEPEETPEPEPPPPPPPPIGGWEGFGGGLFPDGSWRPYDASSPFNTIARGSTVHPDSAAYAEEALSWGAPAPLIAGNAESTSDWSHPAFYARSSDPLYTLQATAPWGTNALDGMKIRVPADARPAGGGDGHLTIVTPDGWEYDLWQANAPLPGTKRVTFTWGGRTRVDGNGLGSGATAAGFGSLAGMIREPELAAGHINHALFITLKCAAKGTAFGYGTRATSYGSSYVYPATHGGSVCPAEDPNPLPMGAHLQLAMSDAQIQALPVPAWRKTILEALAQYGGYVGDTGGPGFGLMFESSTSYTALGLPDPLLIFGALNLVPFWSGHYVFNVANGVDWSRYLRVLAPPGP
jgi:hypothetical protein